MHTLHIYGQRFEHHEAYICGNIEALTHLRNALTLVIDNGESNDVQFKQNDGEGYDVQVVLTTDSEMESLRTAYCDARCDFDEDDFEYHATDKHPSELIMAQMHELIDRDTKAQKLIDGDD